MAVDLITPQGVRGEVANHFAQVGNTEAGWMRPFIGKDGRTYVTIYAGGDPTNRQNYRTFPIQTNGTLRKDEWKALDDAVMRVAQKRLIGINDLKSKGLTYPLANAIGTTILQWEDISEAGEAIMTMDGKNRGRNDTPKYQYNYLPIPVISFDYEINLRFLNTSRRSGNGVDTEMAANAARKCVEKMEDMCFANTSYGWGEKDQRDRNSVYSYVNFPDRNKLTIDSAWSDSGVTGANIRDNIIAAKQMSIDDLHYGPWTLYIPTGWETKLDEDYDSTRGNTIRQRLLNIDGISEIKVADHLPSDNAVLVEMDTRTVRLIDGLGLQNVEWSQEGRWITKYKVLAIQVLQLRSDQNSRCGIVHLATSHT